MSRRKAGRLESAIRTSFCWMWTTQSGHELSIEKVAQSLSFNNDGEWATS